VTDPAPDGVTAAPSRTAAIPAAPGRRRLTLLVLLALVAVAVVVGASAVLGGPRRQVETGIVVAVQATGLTAVQSFTIRTTDGREVAFRIEALENAATFSLGHLAQHSATLVPVQVTYVSRDGALFAVRIEDAR
jgi:hypothetical protein